LVEGAVHGREDGGDLIWGSNGEKNFSTKIIFDHADPKDAFALRHSNCPGISPAQ